MVFLIMSIKSQKSLNDECSEIFERSYSVRSVSDESLSGDDDEESLSRELIKKLTPAVLSKLRRSFKKAKERNAAKDIDRRVEEVMRAAAAEEGIEFASPAPATHNSLFLDEGGFVTAFNNIFGHNKFTSHAHHLFRTLDTFSSGRVWWRQVVARLAAAGARTTTSRSERWTPVEVKEMVELKHCKRETIVKLVSIEREDSFCYAAVSRGGRVGVYAGDMRLLSSYEVFYHRSGVRRRVKNCWITDAIFMSDVQCLLLSASDRSLTIYDVTTLTHAPLYCVTGLPNIPTCLAYTPGTNDSVLVFGTERGDVTRIRFLQPRVSLLYVKTPDNINCYYWMELTSPPHTSYCAITTWRRVHARSVRRLAAGALVLSCALDSAVSVRAKHTSGMLEDYVIRLQRGVSCFHSVPSLHLLATGSPDGVVRLWESPQGSPFSTLPVPDSAAVLDVAVVASMELVVALCINCHLHIWDLYEECLLQSVKIKFPFLGVLGKKVEFGAYCIHPGPPRQIISEGTPEIHSRRGSSVYQASSGGLQLLPDLEQMLNGEKKTDNESTRFDRSELLITCCDFVCVISIRGKEGPLLPPPRDNLRARRPSFWELPADLMEPLSCTPVSGPLLQSPKLLAPVKAEYPSAEYPVQDLDELLEKAGLQGILEKNFVLMQGLKHDLNKKLYEMENNKEATRRAVCAGAPYLSLRSAAPEPLPSFEHLSEQCSRITRFFPESSSIATPTGSEISSPHTSKMYSFKS